MYCSCFYTKKVWVGKVQSRFETLSENICSSQQGERPQRFAIPGKSCIRNGTVFPMQGFHAISGNLLIVTCSSIHFASFKILRANMNARTWHWNYSKLKTGCTKIPLNELWARAHAYKHIMESAWLSHPSLKAAAGKHYKMMLAWHSVY